MSCNYVVLDRLVYEVASLKAKYSELTTVDVLERVQFNQQRSKREMNRFIRSDVKRLDEYLLKEQLAQRHAVEVWRARHRLLGSDAVIKVLRLDALEDERQRRQFGRQFSREARILSRMNHPHIVHFREYKETANLRYIVMEHAPFGSLANRYPLGSVMPLPLIVSSVHQISSALHHLHRRGYIHRDVKPGNVFQVSRHRLVLGDFGLAIVDRSQEYDWRLEIPCGTRFYIAPEQSIGMPYQASDQYSLAVMVHEWLCGDSPPLDESIETLLRRRRHMLHPRLLAHTLEVAPQLERVISRALQPDPLNRYPTVPDFARAFEKAAQLSKLHYPYGVRQRNYEEFAVPEQSITQQRAVRLPVSEEMRYREPVQTVEGIARHFEDEHGPIDWIMRFWNEKILHRTPIYS
jgi:serine/threonine protein kinase